MKYGFALALLPVMFVGFLAFVLFDALVVGWIVGKQLVGAFRG